MAYAVLPSVLFSTPARADASAEDSSLQLFLADASGLLPIIATFHGIADGGIVAGDFRRDGSQQLMIVPAFGDSGEEAIASPAPVAERAALFSAALTDGRTLCWKGRRRDVGAAVDLAAAARRGHDAQRLGLFAGEGRYLILQTLELVAKLVHLAGEGRGWG